MNVEMTEPLQSRNEVFARCVEALIGAFQSFSRDRFHADKRPHDSGRSHREQELIVFGSLHRDLRVENDVTGDPGKLPHQLKPFLAERQKLLITVFVFALRCLVSGRQG